MSMAVTPTYLASGMVTVRIAAALLRPLPPAGVTHTRRRCVRWSPVQHGRREGEPRPGKRCPQHRADAHAAWRPHRADVRHQLRALRVPRPVRRVRPGRARLRSAALLSLRPVGPSASRRRPSSPEWTSMFSTNSWNSSACSYEATVATEGTYVGGGVVRPACNCCACSRLTARGAQTASTAGAFDLDGACARVALRFPQRSAAAPDAILRAAEFCTLGGACPGSLVQDCGFLVGQGVLNPANKRCVLGCGSASAALRRATFPLAAQLLRQGGGLALQREPLHADWLLRRRCARGSQAAPPARCEDGAR